MCVFAVVLQVLGWRRATAWGNLHRQLLQIYCLVVLKVIASFSKSYFLFALQNDMQVSLKRCLLLTLLSEHVCVRLYSISLMGPREMVLQRVVSGKASWGVTRATVFFLITKEMSFLTELL